MQDVMIGPAPRCLTESDSEKQQDVRGQPPRLSTLKWLVLGFGGFTANIGAIVQH